eukprot:Nitzschia sp. Nitz4//scaffold178_size73299//4005//5030//NITZ4_005690-RA/size73299-processed-gene-0.21-mRNA-1//-1//CDS//3329539095//5835//frame0
MVGRMFEDKWMLLKCWWWVGGVCPTVQRSLRQWSNLSYVTTDTKILCHIRKQRVSTSFLGMVRILAALLAISFPRVNAFAPLPIGRFYTTTSTCLDMSKKVLLPIADGSEEIETVSVQDTLVRCGAQVTVASVMPGKLTCKMSRGIQSNNSWGDQITADIPIEDAKDQSWDLIVLPGGMPGATHLRDSHILSDLLQQQKSGGKKFAAICAAPAVVLADKGLTEPGATCYPAPHFREKLADPSDTTVAITGNLTTSKGPGTAIQFALALGEQLFGKEVRDKVAKEMLVE